MPAPAGGLNAVHLVSAAIENSDDPSIRHHLPALCHAKIGTYAD
jgi:hypothetical protein